MVNLGYLEWRPDRRIYDATVRTQESLRVQPGVARVGNEEIRAAIKGSCDGREVNPFEVLGFIAGEQEPKINHSADFGEAVFRDLSLTMADVDRGVRAARRDLHEDAVSEIRLNLDALGVVFAMDDDEIAVPHAKDGGTPLLDHASAATSRLYGFDVNVRPDGSVAKYTRWEHTRDIYRRVTGFLRVVAGEHPEVDAGESWTMYLDRPFAIFDERERRSQVRTQVIDRAKEVINERIAEIDEIQAETATPLRRSVRRLLRIPIARILLRSGPGGQALK